MQQGWGRCAERERLVYELERALDEYIEALHKFLADPHSFDCSRPHKALHEARLRLRDHRQHCGCDPARIDKGVGGVIC